MRTCLVSLTLFGMAAGFAIADEPHGWSAISSPAGSVRFELGGEEFGSMSPSLFEVPWRIAALDAGSPDKPVTDGVHRGKINAPSGVPVEVELRTEAAEKGLHMRYHLAPGGALKLNSLNVTLTLPTGHWGGGKFAVDGKETGLPERFGQLSLWAAPARSLQLTTADGAALQFDFAAPTQVRIQDDRKWGETFSIRFESTEPGESWSAEKSMTLDFVLRALPGLKVEEDGPVTIRGGEDWLPLEDGLEIAPGSALDFSQLISRQASAGELGRVIVNPAGKFAFAQRPEIPARFFGVNLCFTAQYLPHDEADRLAERLARTGYNAVRIHHYEGELVDKASESGVVRLNPEKLDQLDYLVAALKRHGIYLTTDLFVSRPVARSEVYEGETGPFPPDEYKLAVHVNDRAFASYQAFARALLGHLNPYTGLRYADDPALAWLGLVNEDNPGNFIAEVKGQLREDCQRAWNRWLAMRYPDRAELARALGSLPPDQDPARRSVPLPSPFDAAPRSVTLSIFLAELERDFFARTKKFLREEVRCDALLSDLSAWTNPVQLQATRTSFDYIDDHFYVDHPKFLDKPWSLPSRCENKSPVAAGAWGGRERAFTRLFGKPFTVTEFNYAGPGRFRGVGGILTGALASVQDWDGLWRFAYSHSRADLFTAGGMDYFDMVRDPLNLAAERASLCLFLRGDVPPAKRAVALTVKSAELLVPAATASNRTPPWHEVAWTTRVGWRLDGAKAEPGALYVPFAQAAPWQASAEGPIFALLRESGVLPEANRTDFRKMLLQSESGEVTIDAHQNTLTLDTPRTAGGFAPAGSRIVTRAGEFEVLETDATIWVSSLDGEPIRDSHRLLLTHFTDLQNSETRYADRSRQVLLAWGHLPHLVRAGRALVTLRLSHPGQAKVFALKMTGERSGEIPAQVGEDTLAVPVSVAANGQARMCYEIAVGPR